MGGGGGGLGGGGGGGEGNTNGYWADGATIKGKKALFSREFDFEEQFKLFQPFL